MRILLSLTLACILSTDVDSVRTISPEYVKDSHLSYLADADVKKKKKKKGKKLSEKGKKKKKGFFSKVFGSK